MSTDAIIGAPSPLRHVAVIIPFFQSKNGVLSAALRSVGRQRLSVHTIVTIYIIDDSSPVSAAADLADAALPDHIQYRLISRQNGGPGAARNTALDALDLDVGVIAFLDSDDEWMEDHLESGVRALECGAQFYFADHAAVAESRGHFETLGAPDPTHPYGLPLRLVSDGGVLTVEPSGGGQEGAFDFGSGGAALALSQAYIAHTSTLILTRAALGRIRFDTRLRSAGEDYLYTFELSRLATRTTYSTRIGCRQGRGVNMYMSAINWDNPKSLDILRDNFLCVIFMRALVTDGDRSAKILDARIRQRRRDFFWVFAKMSLRYRRPPAVNLISFYKYKPEIILLFPLYIFEAVLWRLIKRAGLTYDVDE